MAIIDAMSAPPLRRQSPPTVNQYHGSLVSIILGLTKLTREVLHLTLLAAALLVTAPTAAQENWLFIGSAGRTAQYLDLNSRQVLPNGVTTYRLRSEAYNPFGGQPINIFHALGIDCQTRETVDLHSGNRRPITPDQIARSAGNCPGASCSPVALAYKNFCALR